MSLDYETVVLMIKFNIIFVLVIHSSWQGLCSFYVCVIMIGVTTAIIGDVASHFGFSVGIKDSVTAIVFVTLGTSVPGSL